MTPKWPFSAACQAKTRSSFIHRDGEREARNAVRPAAQPQFPIEFQRIDKKEKATSIV
jgi:hypothetical protein